MYRVIVSLGAGSLHSGFNTISVTLLTPDGNQRLRRLGNLPANPDLADLYQKWKRLYRSYYVTNNRLPYRLEFVPDDENPYHFSDYEFSQCCQQLQSSLNCWLEEPDFAQIVNVLRNRLNDHQCFQWIIESADPLIQNLPWHLWSFFQDYPLSEVAISLPEFEQITPTRNASDNKLKILVILGKSVNDLGDEINVQADRHIIEATPQVSAVFLNKTSPIEIRDLLWTQSWDVVLFAGHSSGSGAEGKAGFLLDSDDPDNLMTIHELKSSFQEAIKRGLKLVIFNSCDSFELGLELMRLNLPQCIAMSEAIPDAVAQRFLRYLIQQWHGKDSFITAFRNARARLQESEDPLFPCSSWLPVICQNPAAPPPTWPFTQDQEEDITSSATASVVHSLHLSSAFTRYVMAGLGFLTVLAGFRLSGSLEFLELKAFDYFHRLRPEEAVDNNILLITIDDADIQYQDNQKMPRRGSLSDVALKQLLEKLKPLSPRAVAVDIFHDFAYSPDLLSIIQQTPNFIAVCEVGFSDDQVTSIAAPPQVNLNKLGFTDVVVDRDDSIRRQILKMQESEKCPTEYGLGLKLAEVYLGQEVNGPNSKGELSLGNLKLPQLNHRSGGYNLPKEEASGYQIMTRYGGSELRHIPLRHILSGTSTKFSAWARNRLIIIGLKQRKRDSLHTPTNFREQGKLTGMEIHAYMASQLIQGAEQGRSLIWWWSEGLEYLWISVWVMGGVMILFLIRNPIVALGLLMGMIALSTLISYILFLSGGWIPWVPVILGLIPITIISGVRLATHRMVLQSTKA